MDLLEKLRRFHGAGRIREIGPDSAEEPTAPEEPGDLWHFTKFDDFSALQAALARRLALAGPKSLWVLDNPLPRSRPPEGWGGAAFKTVLAVQSFHPGLSYATALGETGSRTVLWPAPPAAGRRPAFASPAEIAALDYFGLLRRAGLLLPVPEGMLFPLLGLSLTPERPGPPGDETWEQLFTAWQAPAEAGELRRLAGAEVLAAMEGYKREINDLKERLAALERRA